MAGPKGGGLFELYLLTGNPSGYYPLLVVSNSLSQLAKSKQVTTNYNFVAIYLYIP